MTNKTTLQELLRSIASTQRNLQPVISKACDDAADTLDRLQAIIDPLNRLREDEGNTVTFLCPNPDFNGLPDEAIEIIADWTNWVSWRFSGNTLAECLQSAELAYLQFKRQVNNG